MTRLRQTSLVLKYLGPHWVAYRLKYALATRFGLVTRRSPLRKWSDIPAGTDLPVWLRPLTWPASGRNWGDASVSEADGISLGQFTLFSYHEKHLGCPPDWHTNAFTGQSAPRGRHWSQIGDFELGDIKAIWEPNRFGWAFTLARAHARTGESRLAELYWKLFADWCEKNPPNEGVNWKCGQEATFRLMAVTFAMAEFGRLPNTSEERIKLWSRFIRATGERIQANLDYALSQSNNHGVSECVGLITASLLLPSEHSDWSERGLANLQKQLDELIYPDGGFAQHALIYHRVLLQDLFWLIALFRRSGQPVPDWLITKTKSAFGFLSQITGPISGEAPLYGANDGARILPLDDGPITDMKGTLQAGSVLLEGQRIFPAGKWDESAFWLTGLDPSTRPLVSTAMTPRRHFPQAGIFQWDSGPTRLSLRCPVHFRHRPSQADMLHVDVAWQGQSVTCDAGSYSYNAQGCWAGALADAAVHNVPMLAGREPMQKVGRFLYLPWPSGTAEWSETNQQFSASHQAYGDSAQIQRFIASPKTGEFMVHDRVKLSQPGVVRLHWLLTDRDWRYNESSQSITAQISAGLFTISWQSTLKASKISLVRADPSTARGWQSRHYLALEPAVSLEVLFEVQDRIEISTHFVPSEK